MLGPIEVLIVRATLVFIVSVVSFMALLVPNEAIATTASSMSGSDGATSLMCHVSAPALDPPYDDIF